MRVLSALAILALGLGTAACGGEPLDADESDELSASATEAKMISLLGGAEERAYVSFPSSASSALASAAIDAAKRGVLVRGVLTTAKGHDATWLYQQNLESNGVDVDVRDDKPVPGALVVADDVALVKQGSKVVTKSDAAVAGELAEKFDAALDRAVPAKPTGLAAVNAVTLHAMPESSRDRILDLLASTKKTIDLELYQLQDRGVLAALGAASARGVKVRVMLEPKTVGGRNYDRASKELLGAGVDVKPTPPAFDSSGNVDHAKFCVLDGRELLFGTGNLVRSGLGGDSEAAYDNRDFWVEDGRAASVKEAQSLFDADWARTSTASLTFKNLVVTPDDADGKILALVDGATKRLFIYNQSLSDATLLDHILDAEKRGVDVRVLLGYQPGFGGKPTKNDAALASLKEGKVVAAYLKRNYLHAKGIVSDGTAYVGSQNFTSGGLLKNREVGEIFTSAALVKALADTFLADMASPE